jgi:AcrR family transcriptional regulator
MRKGISLSMTTPPRPYRKTKRADDESRTRSRIVDAAEALHGSFGPARTSVSAVAERAGVTRATVYRHFPDDESLFLACSAQWLSRHRLPDPDAWAAIGEPFDRLRAGLADVYRYFRAGEAMIQLVLRDADVVPDRVRGQRRAAEDRWVATLLEPLPGRQRKAVRAAVAHATAFTTWHSLCSEHGLTDRAAVDLMVGLVSVAAETGGARPG